MAPGQGSLTGRVLLEGKPVHVIDVLADPEYAMAEVQKRTGLRAALAVPLLREGLPIGVLHLGRTIVRPFTGKQIELVTTFADQAVIAIENVRLFDEVQQRTHDLSEALEQQTATAEVLQVISSSPGELDPVFGTLLANAVQLCGAELGNLWLREADDFRIAATYGAPPAYADYLRREPVLRPGPGTALGRVARTRQVAQIADARTDEGYAEPSPTRRGTVELAGGRTLVG